MGEISAVIITFNEQDNIEQCLKSIIDIADEIIVLDSFSTDKTEEICKKYNVNFKQHAFDGHIQQKNRVIEAAQYNYVLSLDADEVLSEELKKSILEVKQNLSFDSYYFNRLNYFCGKAIKHSGWYPDKKIRIWNKNKALWGGVNPHDTVVLQKNTSKLFLKGNLLHYTFNTIEQHLNQINKFSTIKATTAFANNKKTNILKIIFKPPVAFFIQYIIKGGFLDGFFGFIICKNSAYAEFLKQIKLKQLYKNGK